LGFFPRRRADFSCWCLRDGRSFVPCASRLCAADLAGQIFSAGRSELRSRPAIMVMRVFSFCGTLIWDAPRRSTLTVLYSCWPRAGMASSVGRPSFHFPQSFFSSVHFGRGWHLYGPPGVVWGGGPRYFSEAFFHSSVPIGVQGFSTTRDNRVARLLSPASMCRPFSFLTGRGGPSMVVFLSALRATAQTLMFPFFHA